MNRYVAESHAARVIAEYWLEFAEGALARGEKPARFTGTNGLTLARNEMDRPIYNHIRRHMRSSLIEFQAAGIIRRKLREGKYPRVFAHFTAKACVTPGVI